MKKTLLDLERSLFRHEITDDRSQLEKILHERFHEMGSSGMLYDRREVIEALHELKEDRRIELYDFTWQAVGRDCFLVHYITRNEDGVCYFRTSLWVEEDGLKLIFHQSSRMARKPEYSTV